MSLTTKETSRSAESSGGTAQASNGMLHSVQIYPAFRLLLLGTMASSSAFWMYQVAVGWLALQMTDSPLFVGMAGFAGGIPILVCSLPAGVIIDRYDRRMVLLVAQFGVLVVSALFALLVGADFLRPWSMLVLVATYGTVMSFIFPTRTTIVSSLVARDHLANAVALNSASQNATRVIGPSLAGVLIGVLGVPETFAVAAVLQALAMIATTRLPSIASEAGARAGRGWESLTQGVRIVAESPHLIALIALALAPTVLVMPYINLMPVFARDELGVGSTGLGILLGSTGIGTVAGSLSVARSSSGGRGSASQILTAVGFAVCVMAFSVTPVIVLAALLLFVAGWLSASFLAINQTVVQLSVDDHVRGRVLSIYLLTWGVLPIGQLTVGAMASALGTPMAMVTSCLLAIGCILYVARRYPSLRG